MKLCYLSANSLLLAGLFQVLHPNDIHILERFASRVQICSLCPLVSWLVFFRSDNIHLLFWEDSWKETENVLVGGIFAFLILLHRSHVAKISGKRFPSRGQICFSYSLLVDLPQVSQLSRPDKVLALSVRPSVRIRCLRPG